MISDFYTKRSLEIGIRYLRKQLLILAKSRKPNGFCVAGREVLTHSHSNVALGEWVRPVFPNAGHQRSTGAIPDSLCKSFNVLDMITVDCLRHWPTFEQPENWIAPDFKATNTIEFKQISELSNFCDISPIWYDHSTRRDDQIDPTSKVNDNPMGSLMLVQPEALSLKLECKHCGKFNVYASFSFKGRRHENLIITDPVLERVCRNQISVGAGQTKKVLLEDGRYFLTLSLAPEYHGKRYILVAAVIDRKAQTNQ